MRFHPVYDARGAGPVVYLLYERIPEGVGGVHACDGVPVHVFVREIPGIGDGRVRFLFPGEIEEIGRGYGVASDAADPYRILHDFRGSQRRSAELYHDYVAAGDLSVEVVDPVADRTLESVAPRRYPPDFRETVFVADPFHPVQIAGVADHFDGIYERMALEHLDCIGNERPAADVYELLGHVVPLPVLGPYPFPYSPGQYHGDVGHPIAPSTCGG